MTVRTNRRNLKAPVPQMSKEAYLTGADDHNLAHLMFYTPSAGWNGWGADFPKSPVMLNPQFNGVQPLDCLCGSSGKVVTR